VRTASRIIQGIVKMLNEFRPRFLDSLLSHRSLSHHPAEPGPFTQPLNHLSP
jgi:hypothetical protein